MGGSGVLAGGGTELRFPCKVEGVWGMLWEAVCAASSGNCFRLGDELEDHKVLSLGWDLLPPHHQSEMEPQWGCRMLGPEGHAAAMAVPRELPGGTSCPFRGMWGSPSCAGRPGSHLPGQTHVCGALRAGLALLWVAQGNLGWCWLPGPAVSFPSLLCLPYSKLCL